MSERCGRDFDEALLSGYLDQALTQSDEQRVRVHLEDCAVCRGAFDDMKRVREVTMHTEFDVPTDDQWSEIPRTRVSRVSITMGWTIVTVWLVALGGYAAWQLVISDGPLLEKLLVFGGWTGFGLLLLGVGLDRLKALRTDRYRGVQK